MTNAGTGIKTEYETIDLQKLQKYQTFETVAIMDAKIYEYIKILRQDGQPESVVEVLLYLERSSLRIVGVSFAKYQTIADGIGMSMSTVKRAMKVLREYCIIESIPTTKKWKGRGKSRRKSVNITIILTSMSQQSEPANKVEEATSDKENSVENESEPFHNNHSKNNTYVLATKRDNNSDKVFKVEKHPRALRQAVPEVIYNVMAPFFNADELYKTYGILLRAKAVIDRNITLEEYGNEYVDVFLNVIRLRKQGKVRKSFEGLLYASWERLTAEISRRVSVNAGKNKMKIYEECLSRS